jgi:ABC-type polysaccharide/polyol phosphate export permease
MLPELIRYRTLVWNLVLRDLKLKYRDSVLGVVWSLLNPLLMLAVFTLAFRYVLRVEVEHYASFLLAGLLPWTFFAGATSAATWAVIGRAQLVRMVYFPREVLPVATVLFAGAQFLLALAVFLPASILISGVAPGWPLLLALPLVLVQTLFIIGIALFLAAATVRFRDVAHLTEVGLPLLFWVTPITYPAGMAPGPLQTLFRASPLAAFTVAYQDVLFWGRVPESTVVAAALLWTALALVVGHAFFRR